MWGASGGSRAILAGVFFAALIPLAYFSPAVQSNDLVKTRRLAEAQHEIVVILIIKKDFNRAFDEANKIFQMKWPDDQEPLLLKELLGLSDQFRHHAQPELAVRLLEVNAGGFKSIKSQVAIWMDKGYILEGMGRHDDAIRCFKEAQRLEKNHP